MSEASRPDGRDVAELGAPLVESCYSDDGFSPPLAAMRLRWPASVSRTWLLPGGLRLAGPPPARFGLTLRRLTQTTYTLCLVWDDLCLRWASLERKELLGGSLAEVLAAMGSDLRYMLDQPPDGKPDVHHVAA
jgi:hypothetical protein